MPTTSLDVRRRRKTRAKKVIVVRFDSVRYFVIYNGTYPEKKLNAEADRNKIDDGEDGKPKVPRKRESTWESAAIVAGEVLDE